MKKGTYYFSPAVMEFIEWFDDIYKGNKSKGADIRITAKSGNKIIITMYYEKDPDKLNA